MKEQMSDVISELSKIEDAASDILKDTEIFQKEYAQKIEGEKAQFDEDLAKKTKEHLDQIGASLEKKNKEEINILKEEGQHELDSLEKTFEENHSKWAQDVLSSLIKE